MHSNTHDSFSVMEPGLRTGIRTDSTGEGAQEQAGTGRALRTPPSLASLRIAAAEHAAARQEAMTMRMVSVAPARATTPTTLALPQDAPAALQVEGDTGKTVSVGGTGTSPTLAGTPARAEVGEVEGLLLQLHGLQVGDSETALPTGDTAGTDTAPSASRRLVTETVPVGTTIRGDGRSNVGDDEAPELEVSSEASMFSSPSSNREDITIGEEDTETDSSASATWSEVPTLPSLDDWVATAAPEQCITTACGDTKHGHREVSASVTCSLDAS